MNKISKNLSKYKVHILLCFLSPSGCSRVLHGTVDVLPFKINLIYSAWRVGRDLQPQVFALTGNQAALGYPETHVTRKCDKGHQGPGTSVCGTEGKAQLGGEQ